MRPSAREGCNLILESNLIYLFGGTNGVIRMNDLWVFSFDKY